MDKKKIEIIVIVLCIVVTGGVLWYGFGGGGGGAEPIVDNTVPNSTIPTGGAPVSNESVADTSSLPSVENVQAAPAPSVFPQDTNMNISVFSSTRFRNLQDYTPLTVSPEEIGRPNPFAPLGQ